MIVDDDVEIRMLGELLMRQQGFEACSVSGLEALAGQPELLRSDVILLDFALGAFTGLDVMEFLHDLRFNAAIILVSGCDRSTAEKALEAGRHHGLRMLGFLPKSQLIGGLKTLLSSLHSENASLTGEDLDQAMTLRQFCLAYQPQVDLATGVVRGVEVLLRWQDPRRGLLYPNGFLPLAEETGRMVKLGWHVLELALAQQKRWLAQGWSLEMSVNIPAQLLSEERLLRDVDVLIAHHHLRPSGITLELTESAGISCLSYARHLLTELRQRGFRLSLDDFGTGFASMTQLYRLPFDELKLDRSFVSRCDSDSDAQAITFAVVELGRRLGLRVVAEGIETEAQKAVLAEAGCPFGQGYYFAQPMFETDFSLWYAQQRSREIMRA
ncbi:EAL domain-containing protein [Kushneria phosphatilytica]|uniref:EAL domain-containing protein n=1 Tax=Kushneria phosphatilytica TaxID=657387 RepID=A0A5C1A422_9GAMM|nr:EAL domain-containing protein [Kushneria phosphatilytica]